MRNRSFFSTQAPIGPICASSKAQLAETAVVLPDFHTATHPQCDEVAREGVVSACRWRRLRGCCAGARNRIDDRSCRPRRTRRCSRQRVGRHCRCCLCRRRFRRRRLGSARTLRLPRPEAWVPYSAEVLVPVYLALDVPVLADPVITAFDGSCRTGGVWPGRKGCQDRLIMSVDVDRLRIQPSPREAGRFDCLEAEEDIRRELRCRTY